MSKNQKIGNNTTSQEIVDYILNINYYEAKIEVEIHSNKNINKYVIKQKYQGPDNVFQEILEPSNIQGIKMTKIKNQLKLENTRLNLSSIFENYDYISDNSLDLSSFIKDYKMDKNAKWKDENDEIIMMESNAEKEKKLWIQDVNKNTKTYILYSDIDIKQ